MKKGREMRPYPRFGGDNTDKIEYATLIYDFKSQFVKYVYKLHFEFINHFL